MLDGRRLVPAELELGSKASNSLVQTIFNNRRYVGQVTKILAHKQALVQGQAVLLQVKWFVPFQNIDVSPWRN